MLIPSILLLLNMLPEPPLCEFGKSELQFVLTVLYSRDIIDEGKLQVNFLDEKYEVLLPDTMEVLNTVIEVCADCKDAPSLAIAKISKRQSITGSKLKIDFYALGAGGCQYQGEMICKCVDGNLFFEAIHYISSIE